MDRMRRQDRTTIGGQECTTKMDQRIAWEDSLYASQDGKGLAHYQDAPFVSY